MQCVRFIYAYMGFAGFSIFFFLTGIISLQLIEKTHLQLDAFSFLYFLYNFAVSTAPCSPVVVRLQILLPVEYLPWQFSLSTQPQGSIGSDLLQCN